MAKYFTHKYCDFCKSTKKRVVYNLKGQKLVDCLNCNLKYLDKQRLDLKSLYNENYYSAEKGNSSNYSDYKDQEKVTRENFDFAYDYIGRNARASKNSLLDIGSAFGYFLKFLPKNLKSEATEISKFSSQKLREEKIKVYVGDITNLNISKRYDFITSFDVIEHVIHLSKFLRRVNLLLKKDGVFIFTTPDFGSIPNKIIGKRSPIIQPLYHNYYFDKEWLTSNLPFFGLEPIYIKTKYTQKISLGHALFLASFPIPLLKRFRLLELAKKTNIASLVVPIIRSGGIEAIFKKR